MSRNTEEASAVEAPSSEDYVTDNAEKHDITAHDAGFLLVSRQDRKEDRYDNDHH